MGLSNKNRKKKNKKNEGKNREIQRSDTLAEAKISKRQCFWKREASVTDQTDSSLRAVGHVFFA